MIVDGQQRLTSLYAVIRGVNVVQKDYQGKPIEIAFNPLVVQPSPYLLRTPNLIFRKPFTLD